MLKVGSLGHYGLRLMTELARAHGRGPLSLTEIARVEALPLPYLEQLVVPLGKGGLVEGTWGELEEDAAGSDSAAPKPSPAERAFAEQHQFEAAREG
jgi:hypothetical protein